MVAFIPLVFVTPACSPFQYYGQAKCICSDRTSVQFASDPLRCHQLIRVDAFLYNDVPRPDKGVARCPFGHSELLVSTGSAIKPNLTSVSKLFFN